MRPRLYRFYRGDELLYVGRSMSVGARMQHHEKYSSWLDEVTHVTLTPYTSEVELNAAELRAIETEHPTYSHTELTEDLIARVKPGVAPMVIRDTMVRPFALRVETSGRKLFQMRVFPGTCPPRLILGEVGRISLAAARAKARIAAQNATLKREVAA